MTADTLRLFLALPLATELLPAALAAERRLERAGGKIRWVEPENLHFTLKFLGEMPAGSVEALGAIAARVAGGHEAFSLHIASVGAFPRPAEARAIWLGCREGAGQLAALATELDEALAEAKLTPREARPFKAHLTIGRNKGAARSAELAEAITEAARLDIGQMQVTQFVLMRSELRREGPVYTVQSAFDLTV